MSEKDGGSAFPESQTQYGGMTLRDYFAGQSIVQCCPGSGLSDEEVLQYARWAYRMADAMIKVRAE